MPDGMIDVMPNVLSWPDPSPTLTFTLLLLASWLVPPLCHRLRLPSLVGLMVAGILLGPSGFQLLNPEGETLKLLSDIGKLYLMFAAGLEIDLRTFRRTGGRSLTFGLLTFAIPMATGLLLGRGFGYGWNASVLIGSLLASHTLLAYPILQRFGLTRNDAVTVTVGATILTDIGALLVLAICVASHQGNFSPLGLITQLFLLAIYGLLVVVGVDQLGKHYFCKTGDDEGSQFLFVLLVLFLTAVGAQIIQIENIVGAFLAGLAINDALGKQPVRKTLHFVGDVLFVPSFFTAMGTLIVIPVFASTVLQETSLVMATVFGLVGSKFLASWVTSRVYGYRPVEMMVMWSLSLPQVAATLAAALVGLEAGLLDDAIFNSVIVLMLVTSILGPLLTQHYAEKMTRPLLSDAVV